MMAGRVDPQLAAILDRLQQGDQKFDDLAEALGEHARQSAERMESLRTEVQAVKTAAEETREIVAAWSMVKTGAKFIKWLAGLLVALAAIAAATKAAWVHFTFRF